MILFNKNAVLDKIGLFLFIIVQNNLHCFPYSSLGGVA